MTQALSADEIIRLLGLQPHPEGGHFCETFRDASGPEARARSTAIYFLLKAGERSHWHRVDAAEVWHFYAGAPLVLRIANDGEPIETIRLGTGLTEGERPQALVPADAWQSAESLGEWTLVGCTVAPGFQFEGFELARPGWEPRAVRNALHEPVIEIAIEPKSEADRQTVAAALSRLALEDAFIRLKIDQESGRTILAGSSEHHLDSVITRLEGEFGLDVTLGAPQVAYRETIRRAYEQDYTHKKQTGGTGQFARVKLAIEPNEAGAGFEFENKVIGGSVPKEYVPGVEKGLNSVMGAGPLAGFPVVDVKVQLIDGAYHEVDSSALAFEIAARHAFREGLQKASPVLLEPIMKVEVVSPEEYVGSVIGDLNARRGQIQGQDMRGNATVITAFAPLANMFGYVNNLRPMSQGRASYTMSFSHYAPIPPHPDDGLFPPAIGMRP